MLLINLKQTSKPIQFHLDLICQDYTLKHEKLSTCLSFIPILFTHAFSKFTKVPAVFLTLNAAESLILPKNNLY